MSKLQTHTINPKHLAHIVCVDAMHFVNRNDEGFCDFTLENGDVIIARRHELEHDYRFRQVLPVVVFTHQGRLWAYKRTDKGGEKGLHNQVSVAVGGHFDLADVVFTNSAIDIKASLDKAVSREIREEVTLHDAKVVSSRQLDKVIAADITGVDAKHIALVTVVELDQPTVTSNEDELETLGFMSPEALLDGGYHLETWASIICRLLCTTK